MTKLADSSTKGTKLNKGENSIRGRGSKSSRGVQGSQGAIKTGRQRSNEESIHFMVKSGCRKGWVGCRKGRVGYRLPGRVSVLSHSCLTNYRRSGDG